MVKKKGISLHVGLNGVDPDQYEGWDGELSACEFDAKDMLAIAKRQKLASTILLTKKATSTAVINAIKDAAAKLSPGDLFLLSYSGHGGQVSDKNHDEDDGNDETWVLYDRMLIDDEIYALWSKFKPGVRICVLSDSCHSGTVTRRVPSFIDGQPASRAMPRKVNDKVYKAHKASYDAIQKKTKAAEKAKLGCTVLLISGCQDNQLSLDGPRNGLFTKMLRRVWNGGKFAFGHKRFHDEIAALMPQTQSPKYFVVGKQNPAFENQTPFTI